MARVYTLAGYIRYAMPLTQPGILSDAEAQHVAAYITAMERPVYPGKAQDYPGGPPVDAVYYPQYPENPMRQKLQGAPGSGAAQ
jgi:cytochrome c